MEDQQAALEQLRELYREKNEHLEKFLEPVEPYAFYREIFPEGSFERKGHFEDRKGNGIAVTVPKGEVDKATGIALQIEGDGKAKRCTITDELDELRPPTAWRLLEIWRGTRELAKEPLERALLCNAQVLAESCLCQGTPVFADGEAVLARLRPQSFIVDLASRPGGTDFDAARRLGHRAIHALSLPAACAPETAGEAVARTVCDMIGQREEAS